MKVTDEADDDLPIMRHILSGESMWLVARSLPLLISGHVCLHPLRNNRPIRTCGFTENDCFEI